MVQNRKIKITYLIVVVFFVFWVFLGRFKGFLSFDRGKLKNC